MQKEIRFYPGRVRQLSIHKIHNSEFTSTLCQLTEVLTVLQVRVQVVILSAFILATVIKFQFILVTFQEGLTALSQVQGCTGVKFNWDVVIVLAAICEAVILQVVIFHHDIVVALLLISWAAHQGDIYQLHQVIFILPVIFNVFPSQVNQLLQVHDNQKLPLLCIYVFHAHHE